MGEALPPSDSPSSQEQRYPTPVGSRGSLSVTDWSGNKVREIGFDYCIVATGVRNGIWKEGKEELAERQDQIKYVVRRSKL